MVVETIAGYGALILKQKNGKKLETVDENLLELQEQAKNFESFRLTQNLFLDKCFEIRSN